MLSVSVFGLQLCHGDWFCGKAVGLLVLHLNGMVLNAYVTHVSETSQVEVPGQATPCCGGPGSPMLWWKRDATSSVAWSEAGHQWVATGQGSPVLCSALPGDRFRADLDKPWGLNLICNLTFSTFSSTLSTVGRRTST